MADGEGCKCAAFSKADCGCDADWTPQELIDARAEIELLKEANSQLISDSAETDTAVRDEAMKVLAPIDVDGDSYAVPSVEDIAASLVAEIARLRDALDGRAAWHYDCLTQCEERVIQRDAEIARLRLTDAEREAIAWGANMLDDINRGDPEKAAIMRGLLRRLGSTGHQ